MHLCMLIYVHIFSHALLGMCLHVEGQYRLVVGEYRLAAAAFSEALEIAQQVYGSKHLQVSINKYIFVLAINSLLLIW